MISIYGIGVREPDPDAPPKPDYRGEPITRLRLTSSHKHPLVVTMADKA